jgi:sulfhydrogenase subunit beta (sulfur reductase)
MSLYQILASRLPELYAKMAETAALYLPLDKAATVQFARWDGQSPAKLDCLLTALPPKGLFFPQSETLSAYRTSGKTIEIIDVHDEFEPFVVFGVRACDAASLDILDRVFLSEPADVFYQNRREHGVVVSLACAEPEESCMCAAFGIKASEPAGDVATWLIGGTLYWKSLTEKGAVLTQSLEGLLTEAPDAEEAVKSQQAKTDALIAELPLAHVQPQSVDGTLKDIFDSPEWGKLSSACLGCGSCTFVCPTCHCYDIRDYNTGHEVRRFRCWDSCMYSDFTLMAHGNPRTSQIERFRQRFMHKLVYYPANNEGIYACVGCGRCIGKCPVSMNIAKVIRTLGGGRK